MKKLKQKRKSGVASGTVKLVMLKILHYTFDFDEKGSRDLWMNLTGRWRWIVMAILKSDDRKDLIVTCECGCDEGLHIRVEHEHINDNPDSDMFCYITCLNSNWYRDQDKKMQYVILDKLKKIWAIIRSKDFYYSEICMTRKDFETFREYINEVK